MAGLSVASRCGGPLLRRLLLIAAVWVASPAWAVDNGPVITFMGAADTQGCFACPNVPGCTCDTTQPTPTPEIDDQGRRVFHSTSGLVLLVIEGKAGVSGLPPRNRLGGFLPDDRPDLLAEVSNELGDGDPTIDCGVPNSDGVPKVDPPDFGPGTAITNALLDLACRFRAFVDSQDPTVGSDPCTLNRFGAPQLANPGASPTIQFCSSNLGFAQAFPPGKTTVTAHLRDNNLNLGPAAQIVVDVAPPGFGASGQIRYVGSGAPVAGVNVPLEGPVPAVKQTDSGGHFEFTNLAQATWQIQPAKLGDVNNSISAVDAVGALQAAVHLRTLNATQLLACDVNGDGASTAVDAVLMLQYRVRLFTTFPVAQRCGSDWLFTPVPAVLPGLNVEAVPPVVTRTSCALGAIRWDPLSITATNQDFTAGLIGDCSNNWQPATGGGAAAEARAAGPSVRLGRPIRRGSRVRAALSIDGRATFHALDADLRYDATQLQFVGMRQARGTRGALMAVNEPEPGLVMVSLASARPIRSGPVLVASFRTRQRARSRAPVRLVHAQVDGD